MKMSANGLKLLIREEGKRNKAYRDSKGVWTIGVGHTSEAGAPKVTPGLVISDEEVQEILSRDIKTFEDVIAKYVKVPLNQNQYDALVSLVFNIGEGNFMKSTVRRLLNDGHYNRAGEAFLMWKKAGNDPDILLPRRKREMKLFMTPVKESITEAPTEPVQPVVPVPAPTLPEPSSNWLVRLLKSILEVFKS